MALSSGLRQAYDMTLAPMVMSNCVRIIIELQIEDKFWHRLEVFREYNKEWLMAE
jgi:hypothetical protein